jgi:hypothetical protein
MTNHFKKSATRPKKYFLVFLFIFFFTANMYSAETDYAYAQRAAASLAFLNQGSNIAGDNGVMSSVLSVAPNTARSVAFFGAVSSGELKYKTNSQRNRVDMTATSLIVGIAKGFNIGLGELNLGSFFELGLSKGLDELNLGSIFTLNYTVYAGAHDNNLPVVELEGSDYNGGGLLGRIDFKNNFYGEFSGRVGFNKADFLMKLNDLTTKYDYSSTYAGYHIGAGHIFRINNILKLDTYSKYFFMRKFSKNVKLSNGGSFKFANANSRRVRIGSLLSFIFSEHASVYCGAAWEYELLGFIDIKDSADTLPNLKGGSFIWEVGAADSFKDFYFDVGARFFAGEVKGASGVLRVSFDLFSRVNRFLGYSIEKFYSDKIKKFSKNFEMSKKDCFDKTLKIIKKLRSRVTHKNFKKGYIISFDYAKSFEDCCLDSTEVGIFITETNTDNVTVEVCSNNSILGEKFSVKFFEMLVSKTEEETNNQEGTSSTK